MTMRDGKILGEAYRVHSFGYLAHLHHLIFCWCERVDLVKGASLVYNIGGRGWGIRWCWGFWEFCEIEMSATQVGKCAREQSGNE